MSNKNPLKQLGTFISSDKKEIENHPCLAQINEFDNCYFACDGYKAAILWKDEINHYMHKTNSRTEAESLLHIVWECNDKDNYTITVNRKELLKSFETNWKPFKQYCSEHLNLFAKKSNTVLKFFINYDKYELSYNFIGYNTEYATDDTFSIDFNESTKDKTFTFGLNLQQFTDVLEFFDEDFITIKFYSNASPFAIEEGNKYSIIIPIRVKY